VEPNRDRRPRAIGAKSMAYSSVYYFPQDKVILEEGGYRDLPYHVGRWSKEAGEAYGRGAGWTALADQKMIHEMARTVLMAGQKAADPPLLVASDGTMEQVRTTPGALIPYKVDWLMQSRRAPIEPLPQASNFIITEKLIEMWRQQVRNAYFAPLLQFFEDPRMTATQVIELSNQIQRLMAPMLGRLQSELLRPLVERVFNLLSRTGEFLSPPEVLQGQPLDIEYVSPIMRSQRASEVRSVVDVWTLAGQMAQIDPTVLDNLSADRSIRLIHEANGAPASILRDPEDVEALRQAKAEQIQAQEMMSQIQQGTQAVKNLAPFAEQPQAAA
jgi:hypothetical protein